MKQILFLFFIFLSIYKINAQENTTIVIKDSIFTIYKRIDSIGKWEWYYSRLNVAPFSENVIFRSKIGIILKPKFTINGSIFSIVHYEKTDRYFYQIAYCSWKFGNNRNIALDWKKKFEQENLIYQDTSIAWSIYGTIYMYSSLDNNVVAEDFGFTEDDNPYIVQYNSDKRWKSVYQINRNNYEGDFNFEKDCVTEHKIPLEYIERNPIKLLMKQREKEQNKNYTNE